MKSKAFDKVIEAVGDGNLREFLRGEFACPEASRIMTNESHVFVPSTVSETPSADEVVE